MVGLRGAGVLASVALLLVGCGRPLELPAESEIDVPPVRFFYPIGSSPPCAGTVPFLAATAVRIASHLGLPAPPRIDYHFRPDISADCPPDAAACTDEVGGVPTIWSTLPLLPHELVHAVVMPLRPMRFFAEGLAVALGGDDGQVTGGDYQIPISQFFAGNGEAIGEFAFYSTAGDFSSYLLDRWGPARYAALDPMVPSGSTFDEVEAGFTSVYGETLEQAISERQASGRQYANARLGFPECSIEPTPWQDGRWSFDAALDCATNAISNNYDVPGSSAFAYASVEVPTDGVYRLAFTAAPGTYFHWQRCVSGEQSDFWPSDSPLANFVIMAGRAPRILAWLSAGRYFISFDGPAGAPIPFAESIEPSAEASTSCGAPDAMIDPATDSLFLAPSPTGPTLVASFAVPAARAAQAVFGQASLALCDGGCAVDGAGCQMLSLGDRVMLEPGHSYSLVSRATGLHSFAGLALP